MTRTQFLREQTISNQNKCNRAPLPADWTTANEPVSLPERKALGLKMIFDRMPLFIGKKELIVGTRTLFKQKEQGKAPQHVSDYSVYCGVPYVNEEDVKTFGCDQSYLNITHYTPDLGILLQKGVQGILDEVNEREQDCTLTDSQQAFLASVHIAYQGLQNLITRYAEYAHDCAKQEADEVQKKELLRIGEVCSHIAKQPPCDFYEAVQLIWFGHLGIILESHEFITYGRLDVILQPFLKDYDRTEAQQLLACLLLKMYDQVDIIESYLHAYAAQLVVTLGGVLPNGENAVGDVTMMFLEAINEVRLPEPEFNLRIHSKNPKSFLQRACELTVNGCNFVSYYNDDLFIESMIQTGLQPEMANDYAFDLCQDINIPGKGDFFVSGWLHMANELMAFLQDHQNFPTFADLLTAYQNHLATVIDEQIRGFNAQHQAILSYRDGDKEVFLEKLREKKVSADWGGRSIMCPLPYLSALYHGALETATDMTLECYPVKDKGYIVGVSTEAINSLAAIKTVVYDKGIATLAEVVAACNRDYQGEGDEVLRQQLWHAPKWGNDDEEVDRIAVDCLEFCLKKVLEYRTVSGGRHLAGIHQPHPVPTGKELMATPEGRHAGEPTAVTLTPENGTMKQGPTAALKSATKIDYKLVQWNYCVMVNYYASVFRGNDGAKIFQNLLEGYFSEGGLQHQPNILDVNELKEAQIHPEQYKDLVVRLWGVSAHFVDLPKELQDEMIARFTAA